MLENRTGSIQGLLMAVTLADLARASGFSKSTVSCALRDLGLVDPKTKARILAVAKELGYQPNAPAAMLALQRHRAVEVERQVPVALLRPAGREDETSFPVFHATARQFGLEPRLVGCDMSRSPDLLLKKLWAEGVEGLFLHLPAGGWSDAELAGADWSRFAVVKATRMYPSLMVHLIRHSAFDYLYTTLREMIARGYRRIAVLMRETGVEWDDASRLGAILAAQKRLMPKGGRIFIRGLQFRRLPLESREKTAGWVRRVRPDGILAFPSQLGVDLQEAGFAIPADFGLATPYTFPNVAQRPLIAGCDCQFEAFERRAVERLYKMLQLGERGMVRDPVEEVVEPVWVTGETLPRR